MKLLPRIILFVSFALMPLVAYANGDDHDSHTEEGTTDVASIDPMVLGLAAGGVVLVGALLWFFLFRKKIETTDEHQK